MSKCLYCGNNPVNHKLFWLEQSFSLWGKSLKPKRKKNQLALTVEKGLDFFTLNLLNSMAGLKLAKKITKAEGFPISRAFFLWEEAEKRGIKMYGFSVKGRPMDFYVAEVGGKKLFFDGLPRPNKEDDITWLDDKFLFKEKLREAGLPVPQGSSFSNYGKALEYFQKLPKPVIVKPRLGSRGRHTTTYIYDEKQFEEAFHVAKQLCRWVIVEEHIVGPVWRGTIVGGKLAGVLGGDPPKVMGDGEHTIEELVKAKNEKKDPRQKDIKINDLTHYFLSRQGLTSNTILPGGKTVDLSEKIGVGYGGTSFEMYDETHPETKEMLVRAAEAIGDPLVGLDFILEDITKSYKEQKCGIIECNPVPFINLHHDPLFGKPQNAAGFIWDLFE